MKLRSSATDVDDAISAIEEFSKRLRLLAVEVYKKIIWENVLLTLGGFSW